VKNDVAAGYLEMVMMSQAMDIHQPQAAPEVLI
jgi:hypothetical protein